MQQRTQRHVARSSAQRHTPASQSSSGEAFDTIQAQVSSMAAAVAAANSALMFPWAENSHSEGSRAIKPSASARTIDGEVKPSKAIAPGRESANDHNYIGNFFSKSERINL